MAFKDSIKLSVKKKAHFCCCLCHALYVEVHHIIPESEDGPDTEDNAAPLCPSCHETYGNDPKKRKFIREARDFWYEICASRFKGDTNRFAEISSKIESTATKENLDEAIDEVKRMLEELREDDSKNTEEKKEEVSQFTGMLGTTPFGGVSAGRHCKKCGTTIGLMIGDQGKCPNCGTPW